MSELNEIVKTDKLLKKKLIELDVKIHDKLKSLSVKNERSLNAEIRVILTDAVSKL